MPDWTASMQQTFEYYIVDPLTWQDKEQLTVVKTSTVNRDSTVETLGSATIDVTESVGECYVRIYLVTIQNGVRERHPLTTVLVQTPSSGFDGRNNNNSMDGYTPLIELKENPPPIGHYVGKGTIVADEAYRLARENMRPPVVKPTSSMSLEYDFVADTSDTWLSYLSALLASASYLFDLDDMGRVIFAPSQDNASLQPVWTYTDDNSSILYPEITLDHDLYGIPNAVEVIYFDGVNHYHSKVVNDNENSPISTVNRGREILYRVTSPDLPGVPTQAQIDAYAEQVLRNLSSIEYTITYTHGYCPVRIRDCVMLNYAKAGLHNVKAKVISQSIKCEPGCPVTETAVFTKNLWG